MSCFSENCLKTGCRLIQGIDMAIVCISIMKHGVKQILVNHFSTGKHLDQGFCASIFRDCRGDCILLWRKLHTLLIGLWCGFWFGSFLINLSNDNLSKHCSCNLYRWKNSELTTLRNLFIWIFSFINKNLWERWTSGGFFTTLDSTLRKGMTLWCSGICVSGHLGIPVLCLFFSDQYWLLSNVLLPFHFAAF